MFTHVVGTHDPLAGAAFYDAYDTTFANGGTISLAARDPLGNRLCAFTTNVTE